MMAWMPGTCLQLLLHGSEIVTEFAGSYRKEAKVDANKLKVHQVGGIVKDPYAIQILEVCDLLQKKNT
jgi:hypothetical protein